MMIEIFLLDFSGGGGGGGGMRDNMAIAAYILEKSRKGLIFKALDKS